MPPLNRTLGPFIFRYKRLADIAAPKHHRTEVRVPDIRPALQPVGPGIIKRHRAMRQIHRVIIAVTKPPQQRNNTLAHQPETNPGRVEIRRILTPAQVLLDPAPIRQRLPDKPSNINRPNRIINRLRRTRKPL